MLQKTDTAQRKRNLAQVTVHRQPACHAAPATDRNGEPAHGSRGQSPPSRAPGEGQAGLRHCGAPRPVASPRGHCLHCRYLTPGQAFGRRQGHQVSHAFRAAHALRVSKAPSGSNQPMTGHCALTPSGGHFLRRVGARACVYVHVCPGTRIRGGFSKGSGAVRGTDFPAGLLSSARRGIMVHKRVRGNCVYVFTSIVPSSGRAGHKPGKRVGPGVSE